MFGAAVGCESCRAFSKDVLKPLAAKTNGSVGILMLSIEPTETVQDLRQLKEAVGATWPVALDTDRAAQRYGVHALTTVVVLNKDHDVVLEEVDPSASKVRQALGVTENAALPSSASPITILATGHFVDGGAGDHASGTILLERGSEGSFLRIENYQQTDGPDVYFYLTESASPSSLSDVVDHGVLIPVPGGASDGQTTLRGSFNVPLPDGLDVSRYHGIAAWCKTYHVLFGSAALAQ